MRRILSGTADLATPATSRSPPSTATPGPAGKREPGASDVTIGQSAVPARAADDRFDVGHGLIGHLQRGVAQRPRGAFAQNGRRHALGLSAKNEFVRLLIKGSAAAGAADIIGRSVARSLGA